MPLPETLAAPLSATTTCPLCRHHSTSRRPKVVGEALDTIVEFADEDETVYHCRASSGPHSGREVGTVPVSCAAFEPARALNSELDTLMARFAARSSRPQEPR